MSVYKVPITGSTPQRFSIGWSSGSFDLRFTYCVSPEGGWILDIRSADSDVPLVCGIPLVTGADLLEPYRYLGFVEKLYVVTAGAPDTVPTFDDLGSLSNLYVEV